MRILITGAAGFIGSHTVDYLLECGHEVIAVDNFSTGKVANLPKRDSLRIAEVDILDTEEMEGAFRTSRPEAVLHLAAQSAITTAWKNPQEDLNVNTLGTLNLIELCLRFGVSKFVFSSTAAVYGNKNNRFAFFTDNPSKEDDTCNPDTPYGISKLAAEHYTRLMFPNHVILRYGNVYGSRQVPIGGNQVIARAIRHFEYGDDFQVIGHGNQKRDFVNVKDIARLNSMSILSEKTGTFNASSSRSVSVNEVLSILEDIYGVRGYKWEHTEEDDTRGSVFMNSSKSHSQLDWKPSVSLKDGVAEAVNYESNREGRK